MLLQTLQHTPLWVWGLLLGLIFLGLTQRKTRKISTKRLIILPIIMLCLSVLGIVSSFGINLLSFGMWLSGYVLALAINQSLKQPKGVVYSTSEQLFLIPGSWVPMLLIMLIFFTKYAVGVSLALHPDLKQSVIFVITACILFGLGSGMFLARAFLAYRASKLVADLG